MSKQEHRGLPEVRQQRWEFGKDETSGVCGAKYGVESGTQNKILHTGLPQSLRMYMKF